MSLIFATQLTAIATAVLAAFAIATAILAGLAFHKQSQEVRAIEQQVTDQQELTRQQAELLKLQAHQLDLQSQQLKDQRQANAEQAKVLKLQAAELRESLDERKREAAQRRSAQAARVFISQRSGIAFREEDDDEPECTVVSVTVVNTSDRPIYDTGLSWHRGSASDDPFGFPEPLDTIMPGGEAGRFRHFPPETDMAVSGAVLTFRDAAGVTWMRRPDGTLTEHPPDQADDAAEAAIKASRSSSPGT